MTHTKVGDQGNNIVIINEPIYTAVHRLTKARSPKPQMSEDEASGSDDEAVQPALPPPEREAADDDRGDDKRGDNERGLAHGSSGPSQRV